MDPQGRPNGPATGPISDSQSGYRRGLIITVLAVLLVVGSAPPASARHGSRAMIIMYRIRPVQVQGLFPHEVDEPQRLSTPKIEVCHNAVEKADRLVTYESLNESCLNVQPSSVTSRDVTFD